MTTAQTLGLPTGTWKFDTVHSHVGFSVRHMMVSKVKGQFTTFDGQITVADEIENSSVTATIAASSVSTGNEQRDGHLRSADFFNADANQNLEFVSTGVQSAGDDWKVLGDLSINGTTRPVELNVEFGGVRPDGQGGTKAGFEITTVINRKDWKIDFNMPVEGGGVVIGDKITISIDIEADLQK
ncbi:YceI family protein [Cumulibacter soli]|uniref:YceI family protein n=1 Tax=Cumulibacter soli TaxID=2546344 RepID=UPI001067ADD4|nr:YceI family protein [Cumulibacter soli]